MLNRDHTMFGAATFALAAEGVHAAHIGMPHLPVAQFAAGILVCAGFSQLPDIDEPGSAISRRFSILTQGISEAISKVSGGHRHGTHSLLFVALVGGLCALASRSALAEAIVGAVFVYIGVSMVIPWIRTGIVTQAAIAGLCGWYLYHRPIGLAWMAAIGAFGVLAHLAGDALTVQGVPLLWPFNRHMFRLPLIGRTGSARERILVPLFSLACVGLAALLVTHVGVV